MKPRAVGAIVMALRPTTARTMPSTVPIKAMTRASPRTSCSTRRRRQPTARKMPISRVRSKIDMSIVLSMPTEPRMSATAAVVQAMALARRIWVSLCNVVASRGGGDPGDR